MSEKIFKLPAPGKFAQVFPLLIGAVLPLLVISIVILAAGTGTNWIHALPAMLTLPIVAIFIAWHMHSRQVELLPDKLRVRRWPLPRSFSLNGMDLDQARVLDLRQESSLQPTVKLAGSRLPGFRSGWFWLRDGRKAYVLTTSSSRVLYLPRKDGNVLLLGVDRPDALLQSLRDENGRRS
jgi:hypothetical protein